MKNCSKCSTPFPANPDFFYRDRTRKDGLYPFCKACASREVKAYRNRNPEHARRMLRKSQLKQFGITIEQYETMLENQNGVCAICHKSESLDRCLAVDHDHATGIVRSLLCARCNTVLGKVNESVELLQEMIKYIS